MKRGARQAEARAVVAAGALFGLGTLLVPSLAGAVEARAATPPADLAAWALALVVVPFVALLFSGYIKIAVVLSVLRAALGGAIPPRSVTALVALLLALFVAVPVGEKMWRAAEPGVVRGDAASLLDAAGRARVPLVEFLAHHVPDRERRSFVELARGLRPAAEQGAVGDSDLAVLAPAFVVGELKAAFQVGFLLFLPFLVLELIVASLLATLGMHALDPRAVALPFKLLLFVLADGWHLLARGLILGYS